jgi:hypothetical protein
MADDVCSGPSGCGAKVRRVITEGGTIRELHPVPIPGGNHTLITTPAGLVRAHVVTAHEYNEQPAYRIHKCPPLPDPGPKCVICDQPMDKEVTAVEKTTTHPSCDPVLGLAAVRHAVSRYRTKKAR